MKVNCGVLPSSCRMCTKTCQRDLDRKGEEEGTQRTKHTSPEEAQIASYHSDGLMSQLASLSQALAQHIQEGFPVLATKRRDWRCATHRKIHCGWKEGGGVIKSKMIQIWSWDWHENKWEKLRSDPDSLKCPGGPRGEIFAVSTRSKDEGALPLGKWDAKTRSSLWHLYSSEHSQAESLEDHKQHKALMDMLGCVEAELTPGPRQWLSWSMARIRTSQLSFLDPRYPKQRGSALPHTQCLAVQANHTPKCPSFSSSKPGRFFCSCYYVSWKATLHLTLHIGLVKWKLCKYQEYTQQKNSPSLKSAGMGEDWRERCFLSLTFSALILLCRDHAGMNRNASSVYQLHS